MTSFLIFLVGMFIGWNVSQPTIFKMVQRKVLHTLKSTYASIVPGKEQLEHTTQETINSIAREMVEKYLAQQAQLRKTK
jgi:hypothetical protein